MFECSQDMMIDRASLVFLSVLDSISTAEPLPTCFDVKGFYPHPHLSVLLASETGEVNGNTPERYRSYEYLDLRDVEEVDRSFIPSD